VGRGLGIRVDCGGAVTVAVGVAVAVAVADAVAVAVGVAVGDDVGVGVPPPLALPITPIEKSSGSGLQEGNKVEALLAPPGGPMLLKKAFPSFPQGMPTQFAPLVFESNERPDPSPIGVTFNQ
jgi:hypothetical protein